MKRDALKILITCPPMIGMQEQYVDSLRQKGIEVYCPDVVQTLDEEELVVHQFGVQTEPKLLGLLPLMRE